MFADPPPQNATTNKMDKYKTRKQMMMAKNIEHLVRADPQGENF